jgi:RNA polymerase sigma-70 factor (ECF subfamily)
MATSRSGKSDWFARSEIDQAVALLKRGGDDALDKAVSLLQQSVFAFGMRVCGQRQHAEDTMQEVLVKALPYLSAFNNPKALAVWLYKVAEHRAHDFRKS